ncbi:NAD(P)-dependent oxidoreductase, partial [Desulfobulbus sp. F4]|nr:NAD(P)-dependent oxidoreductase [Desulfobulbus sp. F4]
MNMPEKFANIQAKKKRCRGMTFIYPVSLNISGQLCVVIGGGKVAERKALSLLEAG